jgi:hypothetical protein
MIETHLTHGAKGASAIHPSLRLLSRDAGLNSGAMTEDFEALVQASKEELDAWAAVDLSSLTVGLDTRGEDVSLDVPQLRMALDAFALHEGASSDPSVVPAHAAAPPQYLPSWVLPHEDSDALRSLAQGVTPDLVYGVGVPDVLDPSLAAFDRKACSLILIEVGFCADLRCQVKFQGKLDKYTPLLELLRQTWGTVHLVIVPIGNAGTILERTQQELACALAHDPETPPLRQAKALMKRLSAFAAQRLLTIINARYHATSERQSSQGPVRTSQPAGNPPASRPPGLPPEASKKRPRPHEPSQRARRAT